MPRKTPFRKLAAIAVDAENGMPSAEIMAKHGCSRSLVQTAREKFDLPTKPVGAPRTAHRKFDAIRASRAGGLTIRAVCKLHNACSVTVLRALSG